mmetsp:Transcript_4260/g.11905  ORF Transcript_4260/g.11905 Transcript_4260/m.11905 type:complete len:114 (+) Transcript_4260:67-408(+)
MGKVFKVYLSSGSRIYVCKDCGTHLCYHKDRVSKSFQGRHGKAYLFNRCVNTYLGEEEDRLLITGLHTVCDVYCMCCDSVLGWQYLKAFESSQRYKEGKVIIEKAKMVKGEDA